MRIDHAVGGAGVIDVSDLVFATDVSGKKQTFKVLGIENVEGGKRIGIQITNEGVTEKYVLHQVAVFAKLNYQDTCSVLCIMQDERGVEVPSQDETPDFLFEIYAVIAVSNDANITVNVNSSAVVSVDYLEQRLKETTDANKDLTGSGAPLETTSAMVGQSYVDKDTGTTYICVAVSEDGKVTWKISGSGNAANIAYDPDNTELESTNVQEAINELYKLVSTLGFIHIGTTAPNDISMLWIDTTSGRIPKYYNGEAWVAINAVWAE